MIVDYMTNILMKMLHGSHLYGTQTEKSDKDYKGIYLPSLDDYLLENVKKTITHNTNNSGSKNTAIDVDDQLFSLNYFIELCCRGDTYAIDTLHAPDGWEEITSPVWQELKSKRHMFYSKNLSSYLGYCSHQAAKYSIKGSKLETIEKLLKWASDIQDKKIRDCIHNFPESEHAKITYIFKEGTDHIDWQKSHINMLGRQFLLNCWVKDISNSMTKFYDSFGTRAQLAKENKNIDWKAVSHAFRAGYQLREIYATGDLKYPLAECEFLKDIKQGKLHWADDKVAEKLDMLIVDIKDLINNAYLPEQIDKKYWQNWLLNTLKGNLVNNTILSLS